MKSVTDAYKVSVKDYGRQFENEVVITDGTTTETYTNAEITINETFSEDDSLSMGAYFSSEAKIKLYEPTGSVAYKNCSYTINSKLLNIKEALWQAGKEYVASGSSVVLQDDTTKSCTTFTVVPDDTTATLYVKNGTSEIVTFLYRYFSTSSRGYTVASVSLWAGMSETLSLSTMPDVPIYGYFTKSNSVHADNTIGYGTEELVISNYLNYYGEGTGTESVAMGVFYPSEVKKNDGSIEITAYDMMSRLQDDYEPSSTTPTTDTALLTDICTQKGITLASGTSGLGESIDVVEGTCAEQLGWLAGLQGKNAVFNEEGKLEFRWYALQSETLSRADQVENGCSLDEGSFTIASLTSGTTDNVITCGTGKGLSFTNPYMTSTLLTTIWNALGNKTLYTGSVENFGFPMYEVGDIVNVVDKEGTSRVFYLSNNSWTFAGGCHCTSQSVGNPDAEIEFDSESPQAIGSVASSLKEAEKKFSNIINTESGVYSITEEDGVTTGWTIVDNPTSPTKIIKATNGGIGISSNGGSTYQTAITGEGIKADTITTGTLTVGGTDSTSKIVVKDASDNTIGEWANDGIDIKAGALDVIGASYDDETKVKVSYSDSSNVYPTCSSSITPYGLMITSQESGSSRTGSTSAYAYGSDTAIVSAGIKSGVSYLAHASLNAGYGTSAQANVSVTAGSVTSRLSTTGLMIAGEEVVDYVISTFTSGVWTGVQYASGRFEAWYSFSPSISASSFTLKANGLYRAVTIINPPSNSTVKSCQADCITAITVGSVNGTDGKINIGWFQNNNTQSVSSTYCTVYITGTMT